MGYVTYLIVMSLLELLISICHMSFFEKLQTEIYISDYYCRKNILLQCRNKSKPHLDGTKDTARTSVLPTAVGYIAMVNAKIGIF